MITSQQINYGQSKIDWILLVSPIIVQSQILHLILHLISYI